MMDLDLNYTISGNMEFVKNAVPNGLKIRFALGDITSSREQAQDG